MLFNPSSPHQRRPQPASHYTSFTEHSIPLNSLAAGWLKKKKKKQAQIHDANIYMAEK